MVVTSFLFHSTIDQIRWHCNCKYIYRECYILIACNKNVVQINLCPLTCLCICASLNTCTCTEEEQTHINTSNLSGWVWENRHKWPTTLVSRNGVKTRSNERWNLTRWTGRDQNMRRVSRKKRKNNEHGSVENFTTKTNTGRYIFETPLDKYTVLTHNAPALPV